MEAHNRKIGEFKKSIDKIWPKAKKELEKGADEAKRLIKRAEKEMIKLTDKSARKVKIMALQVMKEKLYYKVGKEVARSTSGGRKNSKKIRALLSDIKSLEKDIRSLKK